MKTLFFLALVHWLAAVSASTAAPVQDELVKSCQTGDLAKVRRLLSGGAKVNETDSKGRSALLAALFSRKADLVSLLLQRGADPNLAANCPEEGCSEHPALIFAVHLNDPKLVKLLLDAKAEVSWKDHFPTRRANVERKVEVFQLLRAAGGREWSSVPATPVSAALAASPGTPARPGVSELLPAAAEPIRQGGAKLRLAIIADETTRPAADLVAAEPALAEFQLIERNELDRVLAEQQLSGDFGGDATAAQKIGSLLAADALALVRTVELNGQTLAELRVVRVSPGIVLDTAYRAWPLADVAGWARDVAGRLASLAGKFRGGRAVAVSPAAFRPATNLPAAATLAREAALLVTDQLVRRPDVVVLERAALSEVTRERMLGKGGEFWAGSYIVDGTAEAALDATGVVALTLRLQPVDGSEALAFTARGPRAQTPSLVESLVKQAADALALRPSAPVDPGAEAERQLVEARAAYDRSLFLAAHRAAETAAVLGARSPDAAEWRLKAAIGAVLWQAGKVVEASNFDAARRAGWSEAWMAQRSGGEEWLREGELLELGLLIAQLWREVLISAIQSGDPSRVEALVAYEKYVVGTSFATWDLANTAAGMIAHGQQLEAIPRALRDAFEEALALTEKNPALVGAQITLATRLAELAAVLHSDTPSLNRTLGSLLARRFETRNIAARVAIRRGALRLHEKTSVPVYEMTRGGSSMLASASVPTPYAPAALPALLAALGKSTAPEDEFIREIVRFHLAKGSAQKRAISERLFTMVWEKRDFFVQEPAAIGLVEAMPGWGSGPDAGKLAAFSRDGKLVRTPEWLALRRKLFLLVARGSSEPGPARALLDEEYHPPDENAAELQELKRKMYESDRRADAAAKLTIPPPVAPKRILPTTPSYAQHPPLRVTRSWVAADTLPSVASAGSNRGPWGFGLSGFTMSDDQENAWMYGQHGENENHPTQGYVFRIALPSLKGEHWPLPEVPPLERHKSGPAPGATLVIDPKHVFVARHERFLAVGNRQTREWHLNHDLQPAGPMVLAGPDLFLLTGIEGARGLVRYSPETRGVELLASNRRTPTQTPLDDPSVEARWMWLNKEGQIEFDLAAASVQPTESGGSQGNGRAAYDPATRSWTRLQTIAGPVAENHEFRALTRHGPARGYLKNPSDNVWTLQLPRPEMPKIRIPLDFVDSRPPPTNPRDSRKPILGTQWFWTRHGYMAVTLYGAEAAIWLIPQAELDAYLDSHTPGEDQSSAAAPRPTK